MSEVTFRRGSTPIHTFDCPYEAKDLSEVWVYYAQNN